MDQKTRKYLEIIKIIFILLLVLAIFKYFFPVLSTEEFKQLINNLGWRGPLIVVAYTVMSHVIAPVVGSPSFFASLAIYGTGKAILFHYTASLISAVINFYISRLLGKKWIIRLAGKKVINSIDKIIDKLGVKMLIISRLFGFSIFDVISYAAGLTRISFKKYFVITSIFSLIPLLFFTTIFGSFEMTAKNIFFFIIFLTITGGIFVGIMNKILKKAL